MIYYLILKYHEKEKKLKPSENNLLSREVTEFCGEFSCSKNLKGKIMSVFISRLRVPVTFGIVIFSSLYVNIQAAETAQIEAESYTMPKNSTTSKNNSLTNNAPVLKNKKITVPAPRIPIGEEALREIKEKSLPESNAPATKQNTIHKITDEMKGLSQLTGGCKINAAQGSAPSDIYGAVGMKNLVVVTNTDVGIYNKFTCSNISRVSLKDFFSKVGTDGQDLFDPRVLYDFTQKRFVITVESNNESNHDQYQYLAVSKNSKGTNWWLYRIKLSEKNFKWCKRAVENFWDYPSIGYDKSRWYITANDFGSSDAKGALISIDKEPTLGGNNTHIKCFNKLEANIQPPIVMDNSDSAYFLSPGSGSGSSVARYKLTPSGYYDIAWDDELETTASITVSSWEAAPDAVQPNGQKLDSLDGRFQSASIQRDDTIWNVHSVKGKIKGTDLAVIRFYKFSTSDTSPLFVLKGTTNGINPYIFNPSVAISPTGQAFITASRTTSTSNPSMIMISGSASELNEWKFRTIMTSPSQFETDGLFGNKCNDTRRGYCRWGDYSSTQIDPFMPMVAWGFNQLSTDKTQFDWSTEAGILTEIRW